MLVACEFSGVVREAFRKEGWDAWSCDLEPSEIPGQHLQCPIEEVDAREFDLMIAHPPCTYLTVTGNKWFKPEYSDRFPDRKLQRDRAIEFFMDLAEAEIPHICLENPVGVISTWWRKPDQIIQPWQFGHPEPKKTCLWLKNLPKLKPTQVVEPEYFISKTGKRLASWYYKPSPSPERAKARNRTFTGIATAMAEQWTRYIKEL